MVAGFVARTAGTYELVVGEIEEVALGESCDELHVCSEDANCNGGRCVADVIVDAGAVCDPADTTAHCAAPTSCVGGPLPAGFLCAVSVVVPPGGACVPGATDTVCAANFGCIENVCAELPVSSSFSSTISAGEGPAVLGRLGNECSVGDRDQPHSYRAWKITNPHAEAVTLTARTTPASVVDTTMGWFVPAFTTPTTNCIASNDDESGVNTFTSFLELSIPANTAGELVVMAYNGDASFDFGLTLISSRGLLVTADR